MQKIVYLILLYLSGTIFTVNAAVHRYKIKIDEKIAKATVNICFDGEAPKYLVVESNIGNHDLIRFPHSKQGNIEIQGRYWKTKNLADNACLNYQVNIERYHAKRTKQTKKRKNIAYIEDNSWLWLPEAIFEKDQIELNFQLPSWAEMSTPWQQINFSENRFLLGHQPQEWGYTLMMGDFHVEHSEISKGHHLNIASVNGMQKSDQINLWITDIAKGLNNYLGGYPVAQTQVIVIAKNKLKSGPVPWGDFSRGNGFGIRFVVIPSNEITSFYADWTATHEFSHQLLPKLHYDDIWLSEGLSSYLQYVLMGQMGVLSQEKAWSRLYDAFQRTKNSLRRLPDESLIESSKNWGERHQRGRRMRVYWSGALMFLKADIALREKSKGQTGLNDILLKLSRCCIKGDKIWRGKELANQLDALSDSEIFSQLYFEFANGTNFPEYDTSFKELGIILPGKSRQEMIIKEKAFAREIMHHFSP
jgi:hypothetical protein